MIFIPIILAGLLWWWFARTANNTKAYEKKLIDTHGHNPRQVIESQLRSHDPLLLAKLCAYDERERRLNELRPPQMEVRKIGFRRIKHDPIPAEILRCDRRKAIMQAPGKNCAYVLQRRRGFRPIFHIRQKFCFKELGPSNEANISAPPIVDEQNLEPSDIQSGTPLPLNP